ncbi:MAG: AcrB/AcrD/AcrF family protein, partial [Rhodothermales bacterium]|nr:AcrB/AcrD/AcrF family protein [Rhodothermales bacterium]
YVLKPLGNRFSQSFLPGFVARYRTFLGWMLSRDYSVKHALLRNTLALGSFTAGFVFLIIGGIVAAMFGSASAMVPLAIGGLFSIVGLVGVIFHALEGIFVGKGGSIRVGLYLAGVIAFVLFAMWLGPKEVDLKTSANLMFLPGLIVAVGFLGVLFAKRKEYVLTDNRSKLLNGVIGGLFGIIGMFMVANPGTEFFPDTDPNLIQVTLNGQLGTNIDESNRIAEIAQARLSGLLGQDAVSASAMKNIQTNVGVGGDADFGGGAASPERSRLTLNMVDYADRDESSKITMQRIREQLAGIPGVEIEFTKDSNGPPTGPPVNIEISGENFDEITQITKDIKQLLNEGASDGTIPGLVDLTDNLNTGRPELRVRIDRERAARVGLSTSRVASAIRSSINGIEVGKYREDEDEYDIVARLSEVNRSDLESLRNLTVMDEGIQIPVVALADFEVSGGLGSITRLDLQRVATVTGDVTAGSNTQAVLALVKSHLADYESQLPPGYKLSYTGESEDQAEAFGFLGTALMIGVALIFMIMVAQFNHVSFPFIIMVAVGLSLVGVLLGLLITRTAFGLMTFIGVISLAGIVVNNNIVLIDYIMQLRERGLEKRAAIVEGGATRLRPVLLTAITTIIGLIPLTFGIGIDFVGLVTEFKPSFQFGSENTQFWGPMGTAIITGLTFATFLTLVIVPVMYSVFDSLSLRLSKATHEPIDASTPGSNESEDGVDGFVSGNGAGDALVADVEPKAEV